jgi:hypothetical protein
MVSVYLFARACLIWEYSGAYTAALSRVRASSDILKANVKTLFLKESVVAHLRVPEHVMICKELKAWIPLDRVVRVLKPLLSAAADSKAIFKVMSKLEAAARFVSSTGDILPRVGASISVTRHISAFIQSKSDGGKDVSWEQLKQQMAERKRQKKAEKKTKTARRGSKGEAENHDEDDDDNDDDDDDADVDELPNIANEGQDRDSGGKESQKRSTRENLLVIDMEYAMQLLLDGLMPKAAETERRLRRLFLSADVDGDGVLSCKEFVDAVLTLAPRWHERKAMRVFRDGLLLSSGSSGSGTGSGGGSSGSGGDDGSSMGPKAFVLLCSRYRLLDVVSCV